MKLKLALPLAVFLMLLTVSLCTGSQLFLLLSVLVLLITAGSVLAVLWANTANWPTAIFIFPSWKANWDPK